MASKRILAVEDEADILEVILYNLRKEGFEVVGVGDGEEGLDRALEDPPDLVLLDLMLPGLDGLEICRRLRYEASTRRLPIIMLTAKGEEADVVLGLEVGADDYLVKPFRPRELLARVRAVLRRSEAVAPEPSSRLQYEGLTLDADRHEVLRDGRPVPLTATEFRLLYFLASHPGRVFARPRLVKEAAGEDAYVLERNIDVHVRSIRRKLGDGHDYISTVRGVGYRFQDPGDS